MTILWHDDDFIFCILKKKLLKVFYILLFNYLLKRDRLRLKEQLDRVKRIWYLSPMRAAKVQASLRIRAVSPEPSLLAHTGSESRGTFRQKARSLVPPNGWACAVKICHDGMLEDTNSLDGAQLRQKKRNKNDPHTSFFNKEKSTRPCPTIKQIP